MPPNTRIASNDTTDKREKRMKKENYLSEIFLFGTMTFAFMYFIFLGMELYSLNGDTAPAVIASLSIKRKLALLFQLLCATGFMASEYTRNRSRGSE